MAHSAGIKTLFLNSLLFVSLIASHHIGGGSFEITQGFIFLMVASTLFFWAKPPRDFQGPWVAAILVIFQGIGHWVLPINSEISEVRMTFSHLAAVVGTYFLAKYFDHIYYFLLQAITALFGIQLFEKTVYGAQIASISPAHSSNSIANELFEIALGRAPPFLVADSHL
jgi:hypothetical protein